MTTWHISLPVHGYQSQHQVAVDRVNTNKEMEERLLRVLDAMNGDWADMRWIAIARTHFEQGFMALNRAIFRPTRIKLPGDEDGVA